MRTFLLGMFSSVAAGLLIGLGAWLASKRLVRRLSGRLIYRAAGVPVDRRYPTQQEANADLSRDLARASWIRVLAGRGNELTRDSFREVWRHTGNRLESVEVLLPDPDITGEPSWLAERETELARHDPGYSEGLLAEQVRANLRYLGKLADEHPHIQIRLFNLPNLYRIILTDRVAYVTMYGTEHGRNSPCFVFSGSGQLYEFALRIFTTTWSHARPIGRFPAPQQCPPGTKS